MTLLESTPRLPELLGELSFGGYKEIGFDKILLVEGPTEVLAVQQFLRHYRKDHKIVLLPLGGSSMINGSRGPELEEIKRISANVAVLIDSERNNAGEELQKDRAAFVELCEKECHIACHVLERRAIENYFTDQAVKAFGAQYEAQYQALKPYEALKDAANPWNKRNNWRIARQMTTTDLSGTDLGKFFENV